MGQAPPTRTGGQDEYEKRLEKAISFLGHVMGFGIFAFTFSLIAIEVILNPIYLFAQAKESGVDMGHPLNSMSWWLVIIITFATTGIQYALLAPGRPRSGMGYRVGWIIAIMDTMMDGGGFVAWMNGGEVLKFSGDSSNLMYGIFPPADGGWDQWMGYVLISAICLFHEPFLTVVLGRINFAPGPDAGVAAVNISKWTERAGKLHNSVKLFAISIAPFVMLSLDMLLFPQSMKESEPLMRVISFILTIAVTLLAIVVWEYYNHLRRESYRLRELDTKHKMIFVGALAVTVFDSSIDLLGFNQIIFGEATWLPTEAERSLPFFLTAGLVMLMCTAFEPMNSDLFSPLARAGFISEGGEMGDDFGGGDDFVGGGDDFRGGDDFEGGDKKKDDDFDM